MQSSKHFISRFLAIFLLSFIAISAHAQQVVYDDALENGWQNWSWASTNVANTSPVHSGNDSISVAFTGSYQALYLHNTAFNSSPYAGLTFWINGGPTGGQQLQITGTLSGTAQTEYPLGTVPSDGLWHQYTVPLSAMGVANASNMDGFWIQESSGRTSVPTMYIDDISLTSQAPPNPVNVSVNAGSVVRTLSPRLLGLNATMWDGNVGTSPTQSLLAAAGFNIIRWPGGSGSDAYNWSTNKSDGNTWQWAGNTGLFVNLLLGSGATAIITTNYGNGTPQEAAAWVAYFDGSPSSTQVIGTDAKGVNWQTVGYWASIRAASPLATDDGYNFLRVNYASSLNVNYYEVGNECYGSWENDQHGASGSGLTGSPNDAVTYAEYAEQFITAMKAVNPAIKVGCVTIPDEQYAQKESVVNPVNGKTYTDWTSVLLSTLANSSTNPTGVLPDFIIDHRYPLAPGSETDAGLLASTTGWPADATDLRNQLNNYLGSAKAANIEINATETNDVYSNPGKQSVSLVNGLYTADSIGMLAQTEINELNWWALRNGYETDGLDVSSSIYGWRNYGDYGLISSPGAPDAANTPYPPYYGFKLASHWVKAGAESLTTSSAYGLLTTYGALEPDGSLALLVINKNPTYSVNASISLGGFTAGSVANVYSYGESNDTANSDLTTSSLTGITFPYTYTFPVYSMTVIDFLPPLGPPTGLTATAGIGQVGLSWTAPSGIGTGATYNLYRSTTSGGPYTLDQSGITATTYTDTGLQAGTAYYYVVNVGYHGQASGDSNQATATPTGAPPAAPTGLTATAQQGQIALSWTAPTGTPAATGYNVYRSTTSGAGYAKIASNIALASYTDTAVTGGTVYYYVVTALNQTVEGPDSNQASATAEYVAPNPPTGLTATGGNATVSLTWTAPTGTVTPTGYNVYRSTTNGGPYTIDQSAVSGTSASDTGLTNGTAYYYVVTSENHSVESQYSNQASATPQWPTPNAPTGLTATAGQSQVSLSWTAPTGAVTPTGYNVYRSTTTGGPYTIDLTNISTTTATDTGLTNGTAYYYVVTSLDHTAESVYSNQATATPNWSVPNAPTGLTASLGNAQVSLTWTAPTGTVTATGYNVYRSTTSGGPYTIDLSNVSTTSATDTGLTNGTAYYYVVTALNHTAESSYSNQATATPAWPTPNAPSGLTATASQGQVALSWSAPGGTVVPTGYNVYRATTSGGPYTVLQSNVSSTSATDTSVTNGTAYYYVVTALNHTAESAYSNQANGTPNWTVPGVPTGLTALPGDTTASLSWTAPGGTVTVTGYNIYRSTTSGGPYVIDLSNVSTTSATDSGLIDGTTYYYVVTALNHTAESAQSAPASATPEYTAPGSPTSLTATAGIAQVALSWTAPVGITPTAYAVQRSTVTGGPYTVLSSTVTTTTYTDATAVSGTKYFYVVAALNVTTQGPNSNEVSATPTYPAPNAPSGLTNTTGSNSVTLTWTAPTGTVTATGYNVYRSTTSGGPYTILQSNVSTTTASDTTVTGGTTYYYVVTALNHTAESAYSNQTTATPSYPTPGAPSGLTATAGNATVSLTWTAPGGTVVPTGYNVYRSTTSGGPYTLDIGNTSATSASDTGLTNGTTYYYVVTALNHTSESPYSNQASATPVYPTPNAPSGLTATASGSSIVLTWSAPGGGVTPTGYNVYRSITSGGPYTVILPSLGGTTATDSTGTAGTTYYYVVTALDHTAESADSNQASATVNYTVPNAPTGLTAAAGNATVALSWTAPTGTITATGYDVYRSTTTGGPYTLILSGLTVTSTSDGTVTNGTTYYYVVTALNHTAQSGYSNQASATPQSLLPGAPTNLAATPGNALVTLTWTAATGTVKSYTVYRSTTNGGPYTSVKTGLTTTSYSNTGLTNGTTYYYVVAAVNTNGTGPYSNQASATPAPPVPLAPTNLTAVAGNATVALTWTKPSNTSPTSYSLYRGTTSGGPYSLVKTTTSNVGTTDSTVTNGTTYYYVLTASDASGTSPDSNETSATPELPIPTAPTALKATAGNATVSLSWTKPSNVTPTSYGVYRGTSSGGPYTLVKTVTGTATSDATVTNGTTYYYVVNAVNGSGTSPNSNEASATPTLPIPTAPTSLKATGTSGQVALTWTKPSNVTPASYSVQRATVSGGPYTTIATPTSTSYKDTSVTNGTAYYYVVSATNTSGTSPNSGEASATP